MTSHNDDNLMQITVTRDEFEDYNTFINVKFSDDIPVASYVFAAALISEALATYLKHLVGQEVPGVMSTIIPLTSEGIEDD